METAADREILEESCSSAFFSEEGAKHLNESSFSSLDEETPTLLTKHNGNIGKGGNTKEFKLQIKPGQNKMN